MAGGTPLIGTGTRSGRRLGERLGGRAKELRTLITLLALVPVVLVFAGCGGAGSGGSSQAPGEEQRTSQSAGTKPDRGRASEDEGRLAHPSLGSAEAPVVLTEYSDYQ